MRPQQLESFKALEDEGVFKELFDEVQKQIAFSWTTTETATGREELWQRQRALRDVRRMFKKTGGLDA